MIQSTNNDKHSDEDGNAATPETGSVTADTRRSAQPVAIIGIAFRFPGDIGDEVSLWEALKEKRDLVTQVPAERWATDELQHAKRAEPGRSITFSAGVLSRIDEFDAGFFGISPREAAWLDPQQRLLMELSWEAMENAGVPASSMAGTNCAVYVGISGFDYGTRGLDDIAAASSHSMTGNTLSIAANRLSYIFDLHGPSLAVDTACSSSLVALHHACNSLRSGEASTALVGGVNLLLHPHPFVGFTKASMLSASGRCKSFDAAGDGYVRSEGATVLLLKPLDQALADGNEVHAVILASGVNADGSRKTGITIPSSDGQSELMREVLSRSGLAPQDIDFIEAHGTGTVVGDPIESAAIGKIYGQGRAKPLPIGSIKANLGHLEPASGMAGLVKAVLGLKHHALPPALHLKTPNPRIDFKGLNLELVPKYKSLAREDAKPLVAGINSFGFGGANAHVLIQEFPVQSISEQPHTPDNLPPLVLSARSEAALRALAGRYADLLEGKSAPDFYDIAHAAAFQRDHLEKRLFLHEDTVESATSLLQQYAAGENPPQILTEDSLPQAGSIAFIYSGNGAQWLGMGRALLAESPRFAEILAEIDAAMQPEAQFSILEEIQAKDEDSKLHDTTVAQPLIFAIQVAITTLLEESGIKPSAVAGHSVGEIAAAWAAGILTLAQAISVICARSQAQGLTLGMGRMAAVGMSASAIKEVMDELGITSEVEIAGINSPDNVTLSGNLESLLRIQAIVESKRIFFRLLDLDYAFHSKQMDSIRTDLAKRLASLPAPQPGEITFVSTVTGNVLDGTVLDADYWWRNVREPVRFADAITRIAELGCRLFVEIGPHAILQRYVTESLSAVNIQGRFIPTLRRNDDGLQRIEEAAARLHLLAEQSLLSTYFPHQGRRVRLPNYPWQKERHWHAKTSESLHVIERRRVHPLLGWRLDDAEASWENILDHSILPWLEDHKVGGAIVYPGAAYVEMALAAAHEWLGSEHFIVEQLDIVSPMVFDGEHSRTLRLVLNPRDCGFQIKSRQRLSNDEWSLHATGRLLESSNRAPVAHLSALSAPSQQLDQQKHYHLASLLGLDYGPAFQGLQKVVVEDDKLEAWITCPAKLELEGYFLHPALLDVCFQSLVDFFGEAIEAKQGIALLPVKVGRLDLYANATITHLRAHLRRHSTRSVLADFELFDAQNNLIASVSACRFRAAHLKQRNRNKVANWRITPWLAPHPLDGIQTETPAIPEIATQMRALLAGIEYDREKWFKETLPLIEVLTVSFVYEACQQLAAQYPQHWQQMLASPYGQWLTTLLSNEGLLEEQDGQWALSANSHLPSAEELWQTILRDSPASLPQLSVIGRVGRQLPALLSGTVDGQELLHELQHSPIAEALYDHDPAYLGLSQAIENTLGKMASTWPDSRRLRVLEISAGPSELPKTLIDLLPEDRFEYVLALPSDMMQSRQQAEFHEHANISISTFDIANWKITSDKPLSSAFDVVIVRHTLHKTNSPLAALSQTQRWLAAGGIMLLAERHPDWSADFLEGISPSWWHTNETNPDVPVSSLMSPGVWEQLIADAGLSDGTTFIEPAAEELSEGAYLLLAKRSIEDMPVLEEPAVASWLLLADQASASLARHLRIRLESQGQQVVIANQLPQDADTADNIVHLSGWSDTPDQASATLASLTRNVQALSGNPGKAPHLWLVTQGATLATSLLSNVQPNPAQSALWGFGRVIMNEQPQLGCTLIDLACNPQDFNTPARLENELLRPDGATEIVLSYSARHYLVIQKDTEQRSAPAKQNARFRLDFHVPGQLRNLVWLPEAEQVLHDDDIEVQTKATGLNFRDVMYLMGLLPDEAVENGFAGASLGLEFAGVVSRVGPRVKDIRPGDAVMGFGASCFSSHVVTRADAVAIIPEGWSFEAATTVPTVFFTVYYALKQLADLQPGERVLIHGAAGGVGIAAIQLARHLGAEIYATAGSDEKRDFVKLLGADRVFDSRSLAFADDILAATDGEGVDVVLNSLAGEAMRRSIDVLKPFGRFLELGKRDFFENTPIGLRPFKSNISYFGIDADQLLTGRPKLAARVFREVMMLFHEDVLAPLPYRTFTADKVIEAFRLMQQARHIGKIVVSMADARPAIEQSAQQAPAVTFDKDTTWLVTGGLSGFGLESARWLATRGVGNLVLAGRRGLKTPMAREIIAAFAAEGVNVVAQACDISDVKAVRDLVERIKKSMPPLKGILHAATTFDDKLIDNLDIASIENVLSAKLQGAWNLHQATRNIPLDHFVMYSSVTTMIGNPGQANYVAANAGLEGLMFLRHHMGLPAVSIGWGPISDAGYLTRNAAIKDSLEQRLGKSPIPAATALAQLDRILVNETRLSIPANFEWNTLAHLLPSSNASRFSILNRDRKDQSQSGDSTNIRDLIAGKTPEEIQELVQSLLIHEVAEILRINPERIDANRSLHDLGMDSLMAVELALALEQRFGIQLPVMMLNDSPTAISVTARIVEKLLGNEDTSEDDQSVMATDVLRQHGEGFTSEEIQELNDDARKLAQTGTQLIS